MKSQKALGANSDACRSYRRKIDALNMKVARTKINRYQLKIALNKLDHI